MTAAQDHRFLSMCESLADTIDLLTLDLGAALYGAVYGPTNDRALHCIDAAMARLEGLREAVALGQARAAKVAA